MDKVCICGNTFEAARASAKYCSDKCRKNASRGTTQPTPPIDTPPKDMKANMAEIRERMNVRLRAKGLPLILEEEEKQYFVPTGIPELDALTKNVDVLGQGGFPRKKITEIFGPKAAGKTSLVKTIMKHNPDLKVLFFDAEGGMVGAPENMQVVKGNVVEDVMRSVIESVEAQEYDLIIVDSIASLITRKHFDDDALGIANMARAFGPEVKRLLAVLQPLVDGLPDPRPGVAVVFINQYRSTTNSFGTMEYTVGGKSMEYYASLRLEFRSAKKDYIIRDKELAGQWVRVKVEKTRYGPKDQEFRFAVMFDEMKELNDNYRKRVDALIRGEK